MYIYFVYSYNTFSSTKMLLLCSGNTLFTSTSTSYVRAMDDDIHFVGNLPVFRTHNHTLPLVYQDQGWAMNGIGVDNVIFIPWAVIY